MIIRCRKCETRFRFDDSLVVGDGVWVRCSRCENVFFQEAPPAGELSIPSVTQEAPSIRISDARRPPDDRFPPLRPEGEPENKESGRGTGWEAEETKRDERATPDDIDRRPPLDEIEGDLGRVPLRDAAPEDEQEAPLAEEDEVLADAEPERKRGLGTLWKVLLLMVFTLLVAGGIYLWLFSEVRTQVQEAVSPWLRTIPGMEKVFGPAAAKKPDVAATPIRIKDVRQRSVTNLLSGNLRVLEGTAVNQSSAPLARIRVRLVISDAYDVVLGEKTVFCGNILTDVELSTLAEPEIQRELSIVQGSDVANERIPPGGEIPFMIVFGQEQAGVVKTIVLPAGADVVP